MTEFNLVKIDSLSEKEIEAKLPVFCLLLGRAIRSLIDTQRKVKGGKITFDLFGFWSVADELSANSSSHRYAAKSTWRARKLAKALTENGPENQEVLSMLHRNLLQSEGLNALVSRIQQLNQKEGYPVDLSVGANIVFLLRYVFERMIVDIYEKKAPVKVPDVGLFWIGNRHRFLTEPKYDADGAIQFEPMLP